MGNLTFNSNVYNAAPSPIRTFQAEISHIEGLIDLTLGQPDFNAPTFVHEAAIAAIKDSQDGYTSSKGLPELRQAIAAYLERHYQLEYDAENEILVTNGATGALFSTLFALVNEGDKVLVPSPYYPVYKNHINFPGGEMVEVDVTQDDFILTAERLEKVLEEEENIKAILLNYPSNPTGQTYTADELKALADVVRDKDIFIISDEIYSELVYDDNHVSIAKYLRDQTVVLNGASKSHAMTGWRSGFIAAPSLILDQIFKVNQATINTVNTVAQFASVAAYSEEGDQAIDEMRAEYHRRRDYLKNEMNKLGLETSNPSGAFYLFVQVPEFFDGDDYDFCLQLAKEAKVGSVPGSAFGPAGQGYYRISYATSMEFLEDYVERLTQLLENIKK